MAENDTAALAAADLEHRGEDGEDSDASSEDDGIRVIIRQPDEDDMEDAEVGGACDEVGDTEASKCN